MIKTRKIPFLGICLGMQLAIVRFIRNVVGYNDAHSIESEPNSKACTLYEKREITECHRHRLRSK